MTHNLSKIFPENMRKVLVAGAGGVTGSAYCKLLNQNNIEVLALDQKEIYSDTDLLKPILWNENFKLKEILETVDALTLTPGVPLSGELFKTARQIEMPIFTELEYAASFLTDEQLIIISGTDGKSTTSAMVHHLLPGSWIGGNYGTPLSDYILQNTKHAQLILELSSYQLELCRNVKANCALLLNIAPDHLDRYVNFEQYAKVKLSIQSLIDKSGLFITSNELYNKYGPYNQLHEPHSLIDTVNLKSKKFKITNNILQLENLDQVKLNTTAVKGKHNYGNLLFALEAAAHQHKSIRNESILSFQPLEHRYEEIGKDQEGNTYINDSKATTCQSAIQAVNSAPGKTFWLIGGSPKGEDYSALKSALTDEVTAILFGPEAARLAGDFGFDCLTFVSMEETMNYIIANVDQGLIVNHRILLSPAMASFDSYPNYLERGRHFKELAQPILD